MWIYRRRSNAAPRRSERRAERALAGGNGQRRRPQPARVTSTSTRTQPHHLYPPDESARRVGRLLRPQVTNLPDGSTRSSCRRSLRRPARRSCWRRKSRTRACRSLRAALRDSDAWRRGRDARAAARTVCAIVDARCGGAGRRVKPNAGSQDQTARRRQRHSDSRRCNARPAAPMIGRTPRSKRLPASGHRLHKGIGQLGDPGQRKVDEA